MKSARLVILIFILCNAFNLDAEDFNATKIISNLSSSDQKENEAALSYISKNRPESLLPVLKNIILSKADSYKKIIAFNALKQYPIKDILPLWLDLLKNTMSYPMKKMIIDYIANFPDRRIVVPLVEELNNPFSTVRESAILALKRLGDDRMFPLILNMARDANPIYRVYALEAMFYLYDRRMNGIILDMLNDDNKSVRYYVLRCIDKNRLYATLPQIRYIALSDANWETRIKAIDILKNFNDKNSLNVLVKCLTDTNRDIRFASATALNYFKAANTAFPISYQLSVEDDDEIKDLLIDALIRIGNGGGFRGLEKMLFNEKNVKLKIRSAYAIGEIGDVRALQLLLKGMKDDDFRVRAEICNSLGNFRGQRYGLISLLDTVNSDTTLYVRLSALYSIERLRDRTALLPLYDLYAIEKDPVFKDKLRLAVRRFL